MRIDALAARGRQGIEQLIAPQALIDLRFGHSGGRRCSEWTHARAMIVQPAERGGCT
jgi:hypothetical protein